MRRTTTLAVITIVVLSVFYFFGAAWSATFSCKFKRGDANRDGGVNLTDVTWIQNWLFRGGPAPPNLDAADCNDDGSTDLSDSPFLLQYLFFGGSAPPDPGPSQEDCDPTDDDLEPCCTPAGGSPSVALSIGSASTTPTTVTGKAAFDCNTSNVQTDPRKIDITATNSEDTEGGCGGGEDTDELTTNPCCNLNHDPCNHADTSTRWTFTWNVSGGPEVEKLAFNTGCTQLVVKLDFRAVFATSGPCTQPGGGCPTSTDLMFWSPENTPIRLTFRNQTTSSTSVQNLSFSAGTTSMTSTPMGGNPCQGLSTSTIGTNSKQVTLTSVSWSGNDCWKLEEVEVDFLAQFRRLGQDNSDLEDIMKNGHSVFLEKLEYQTL